MAMAAAIRMALAPLLVALYLSSALPLCSPAYSTEQQKPAVKTKERSPPSTRLPQLQSLDIGRTSSVVFPLYGNVYPKGLYFVSLSIGDPPKPYFLDVDTGSDLTWLQCNAPCVSCSEGPHPLYEPTKDKLVPCEHPICVSLQATAAVGSSQQHHCDNPKDQCDYEVEYADQGSSRGVLIGDAFSLSFVNGSLLRPRLALGCGYDQQMHGAEKTSPTDGVLGLGHGSSSVVSQLREQGLTRNVLGHCLSRKGGGFLFFGADLVPRSGITWTPMSPRVSRKHYSPGPANLYFGGVLIRKKFQVILDSGSSYTYFSSWSYGVVLQKIKKDLTGKLLVEAPQDHTLPLCWKGAKPFKSVDDVRRYFKTVTLGFGKGAQLDIPPEGYLIVSEHGNVCLGILNGAEAGLGDLNIIGDISVQDVLVVYDNEKEQIGWAPTNCDRLPNADRDDGSEEGVCWPQFASVRGVLTPECPAYGFSTTY